MGCVQKPVHEPRPSTTKGWPGTGTTTSGERIQKAGEIRRLSLQLASHAVRLAELELPERDANFESQRGFAETQRQLDRSYGAIQVSFNRLSQATRTLKSLKTRALDLQEALPVP